jgi:Tfp pilus assembly protein PilE
MKSQRGYTLMEMLSFGVILICLGGIVAIAWAVVHFALKYW